LPLALFRCLADRLLKDPGIDSAAVDLADRGLGEEPPDPPERPLKSRTSHAKNEIVTTKIRGLARFRKACMSGFPAP
jgi:hypothetical protein